MKNTLGDLNNHRPENRLDGGLMNDTQISAKHWEKAMLHANWDTEE